MPSASAWLLLGLLPISVGELSIVGFNVQVLLRCPAAPSQSVRARANRSIVEVLPMLPRTDPTPPLQNPDSDVTP